MLLLGSAYCIAGKFGGEKVWQIWRIMSVSPNYIKPSKLFHNKISRMIHLVLNSIVLVKALFLFAATVALLYLFQSWLGYFQLMLRGRRSISGSAQIQM